jgi:hypothetical protein
MDNTAYNSFFLQRAGLSLIECGGNILSVVSNITTLQPIKAMQCTDKEAGYSKWDFIIQHNAGY